MSGVFGSSDTEIPPPDPAIGQAALRQAEIGQESLDFFKRVYLENKPRQERTDELANQLTEAQIGISQDNRTRADEQWERFVNIFAPIEEQMARDAMEVDSQAEQEKAAGAAAAGVQSQYDNAIAQGRRNMMAMGVNPNSGRAMALEKEGALGLAAAKAGAANSARQMAKDRGIALRAGASNFGRNMPNTAAGAYGIAVSSGNSAMGNNLAAQNAANANANMMSQGFSQGMQGYAGQASALNSMYSTQMQGAISKAQADSQSSGGFGQLVGMVGAAAMMSSKKVKEDKRAVDDEQVLDMVRNTPVDSWKYKEGVEDGGRHIGPYAEDMQQNFGDTVAPGGKMIDLISMAGVNMSATKGLDKRVDRVEKRIDKLEEKKVAKTASKVGTRRKGA